MFCLFQILKGPNIFNFLMFLLKRTKKGPRWQSSVNSRLVYLGFWMAYLMYWLCSHLSKFKLLKQNSIYILSKANIFSFKLNWGIQHASIKVWVNQLPVGVDDLKSWLCRTNNQTNKHFTWLKFSNQNKKDQQIIGRSIPAALQPDWRDFLLSQPGLPRLIAHR